MEPLNDKPTLLVITNIESIDSLYERLENKFQIIYEPDATVEDLKNLSISTKNKVKAIFTNPNKSKVKFDSHIIDLFKNIVVICTASTGTVHIDKNYCNSKNIKILSLKDEIKVLENVSSTAELAFTFLLIGFRNIIGSINDVKNNNWDCDKFIGRQINHLKIGIIGYGRLGKMFAKYAKAFGATIYVYDPYITFDLTANEFVPVNHIKDMCNEVDCISIHVHASNETSNMVNENFLKKCKSNILIINTSRGEIVNEIDMLKFLKKNKDARYFTDVIADEILNRSRSPIYLSFINGELNNQVLITPHIGGMTSDARYIAYHRSVDLLENFYETKQKKA